MDTSGANANLPPPLRTVFFCPQHFKSWIPAAVRVLPTRVILSHIVFNARPCFNADENKEVSVSHNDAATSHDHSKRAKRRKLKK